MSTQRLLNAAKSIRDNWTQNLTPYMAELNAAIDECEAPKYRKGTLEHKLDSMLEPWKGFEIIFHELIRESEGGWSVNDSWKPFRNADRAETISALRSRWEVFKANYMADARVKDLSDIGEGDEIMLEVNCTAFATLRKVSE